MSGIIKPPVGAQLNLSHPFSRGLLGSWLLNEGSGKAVHDSSGQGNEGTLINMADPPAASGWCAGPFGNSLLFNGSGYVDCGTGLSVRLGTTTKISVIIGFEGNDNPANEGLFEIGKFDDVIKTLTVLSYAKVLYWTMNNSAFFHNFPTTTPSGDHVLALVYDGATALAYLNNLIMLNVGYADPLSFYFLERAKIGVYYSAPYCFNGKIHFVHVYDRPLSAVEVAYITAFPFCMYGAESYPAWMKSKAGPAIHALMNYYLRLRGH